MTRIGPGLITIALIVMCGCNGSKNSQAANPPPSSAQPIPSGPTAAQARLPTTKIWMGNQEMIAELAATGLQQQTGMMFRTNMPENEGMLFLFPHAHRAAFWMMNTYVPLSAAYIDPNGIILEIHDLHPRDTNNVVAGTDQVQ